MPTRWEQRFGSSSKDGRSMHRVTFYGERLLVVVTLNGRHFAPTEALDTEFAEGDRIDLLLPVAGG